MHIFLLDRNGDMIDAWNNHFYDRANIEIVKDDFCWFMDNHPEVDCAVAPANSYGLMDGGYDAAITRWFGSHCGVMIKKVGTMV